MHVKVDELYQFLKETLASSSRFPELPLSSVQRLRLGGWLFARAPDFVRRVALCMRANESLFQHYPVSSKDLLAYQDRASAWKTVAQGFLLLYEWANDWFLYEQSQAIIEAKMVLRRVEAEKASVDTGGPWQPDGMTSLRRFVLQSAFETLSARKRQAKGKQRTKAAKRKSG